MTVLVVEDNEDFRTIFAESLRGLGFNVVVAVDGMKGVEAIDGVRPDVIITDLEMPNADGYYVLQAAANHIPCFMCTGRAFDPGVRKRATDLGAKGVFDKSEFQQLFETLSKEYKS